jgi:ATP-dependent helicase YprA (DUF1998 family)
MLVLVDRECYFFYNRAMNDENKDYKVERALEEISKLRTDDASNIRIVKIDHFDGEFMDYPANLCQEVKTVYQNKGIDRLFSHQSKAIQEVLEIDFCLTPKLTILWKS